MIQEFNTLFFAGTDTTATVIASCLFEIARNPKISEELVDEVKSVVKGVMVQPDELKALKLVTAFIQEILRLYPPVFGTMGRLALHDVQINNVTVKKGDN
jgi:cytochrome P450